jgi:hypothetical protein
MKGMTSVSSWLKKKFSAKPKIQIKKMDVPKRNEDLNDIPSNSHMQNYLQGSHEFYPKHTKRKGYMNSKSTFNKNK